MVGVRLTGESFYGGAAEWDGVYTVAAQDLGRDGSNNALTQILPAAQIVDLGGGGLSGAVVYGASSTVRPFIAAGSRDGQSLRLRNVHATYSIQFNAGVANSGIKLVSNTLKSVGPKDWLELIWRADSQCWEQVDDVALLT